MQNHHWLHHHQKKSTFGSRRYANMLGCALARRIAKRKVFYTRSALLAEANSDVALKSKSLRRLSRKSISDIISFISRHRIVVLDEATLKLADKKIIYVLNSGGQPTASNAARLLAIHGAKSGRNVVWRYHWSINKEIKEYSNTRFRFTYRDTTIELAQKGANEPYLYFNRFQFKNKRFNWSLRSSVCVLNQ